MFKIVPTKTSWKAYSIIGSPDRLMDIMDHVAATNKLLEGAQHGRFCTYLGSQPSKTECLPGTHEDTSMFILYEDRPTPTSHAMTEYLLASHSCLVSATNGRLFCSIVRGGGGGLHNMVGYNIVEVSRTKHERARADEGVIQELNAQGDKYTCTRARRRTTTHRSTHHMHETPLEDSVEQSSSASSIRINHTLTGPHG